MISQEVWAPKSCMSAWDLIPSNVDSEYTELLLLKSPRKLTQPAETSGGYLEPSRAAYSVQHKLASDSDGRQLAVSTAVIR